MAASGSSCDVARSRDRRARRPRAASSSTTTSSSCRRWPFWRHSRSTAASRARRAGPHGCASSVVLRCSPRCRPWSSSWSASPSNPGVAVSAGRGPTSGGRCLRAPCDGQRRPTLRMGLERDALRGGGPPACDTVRRVPPRPGSWERRTGRAELGRPARGVDRSGRGLRRPPARDHRRHVGELTRPRHAPLPARRARSRPSSAGSTRGTGSKRPSTASTSIAFGTSRPDWRCHHRRMGLLSAEARRHASRHSSATRPPSGPVCRTCPPGGGASAHGRGAAHRVTE